MTPLFASKLTEHSSAGKQPFSKVDLTHSPLQMKGNASHKSPKVRKETTSWIRPHFIFALNKDGKKPKYRAVYERPTGVSWNRPIFKCLSFSFLPLSYRLLCGIRAFASASCRDEWPYTKYHEDWRRLKCQNSGDCCRWLVGSTVE